MKVAIAGYGVEGSANLVYWQNLGGEVEVFDEKAPALAVPAGVPLHVSEDAFQNLEGFDLVVRTAGLSPNKIRTNGKVWSATNEFFEKCPADIIGVTGTKGKGTTCSLIAETLRAAGKKVHLLGNIGVPSLEVLPNIQKDDIVVFELSSFQLWDLKKSPHTAVVLMIEPDHQDVHESMDDYIEAKGNIARFQYPEDTVIYHPANVYARRIADLSLAHQVPFGGGGAVVSLQDGGIYIKSTKLCDVREVGLVGPHNLENICAALTAALQYTDDVEAMRSSVLSFKGLPHRLEPLGDIGGVRYFDDSFSSAPGAVVAAMRSFDEPKILIIGGFDRGLSYHALADAIALQKNIKKILLIGQTGAIIAQELERVNAQIKYEVLTDVNMSQIVTKAADAAEAGDVVLLSPGCASFDMFKDFKDRGEQFKLAVRELHA